VFPFVEGAKEGRRGSEGVNRRGHPLGSLSRKPHSVLRHRSCKKQSR
jgi:hypothetical protein